MGARAMEELKNMICRELEEIAQKGEMSPGDLDTVYKLIMSKEKLLRIDEIEEDMGYSHGGRWSADGSYGRESYDGGSYGGGNSYAGRRHYVRGHYSRGRYSYEDGRRELSDRISEMMGDDMMTQSDKQALRRAMDVLNK